MIQFACSNTSLNDTLMYTAAMLLAGAPLAGVIYSYLNVITAICVISSAQGKYKALSTCASHLSVASLYYCTSLGVYISPAATYSFSDVHLGHTHAQPHYLQSEKPRHKGGSEKSPLDGRCRNTNCLVDEVSMISGLNASVN